VFRTYQAVLQPTAGQGLRLARLLGAQRELYNAALEERIGVCRWEPIFPMRAWRSSAGRQLDASRLVADEFRKLAQP
jgi:hypothetical protein